MSLILAAHLQLQDQISAARAALLDAGFGAARISSFYVNQPGQHDLYPPPSDTSSTAAESHGAGVHPGSWFRFHSPQRAAAAEAGGHTEPRKAGMLIAVTLDDADQRQRALEVLHQLGADHIEEAQGTISDGDWSDFDPLTPPRLVE